MTRDQWESWLEHPATKVVFLAARSMSERQREAWISASWEAGHSDPLLLTELRSRADAYAALHETTYEQWCEAAGIEVEPE